MWVFQTFNDSYSTAKKWKILIRRLKIRNLRDKKHFFFLQHLPPNKWEKRSNLLFFRAHIIFVLLLLTFGKKGIFLCFRLSLTMGSYAMCVFFIWGWVLKYLKLKRWGKENFKGKLKLMANIKEGYERWLVIFTWK